MVCYRIRMEQDRYTAAVGRATVESSIAVGGTLLRCDCGEKAPMPGIYEVSLLRLVKWVLAHEKVCSLR